MQKNTDLSKIHVLLLINLNLANHPIAIYRLIDKRAWIGESVLKHT